MSEHWERHTDDYRKVCNTGRRLTAHLAKKTEINDFILILNKGHAQSFNDFNFYIKGNGWDLMMCTACILDYMVKKYTALTPETKSMWDEFFEYMKHEMNNLYEMHFSGEDDNTAKEAKRKGL